MKAKRDQHEQIIIKNEARKKEKHEKESVASASLSSSLTDHERKRKENVLEADKEDIEV